MRRKNYEAFPLELNLCLCLSSWPSVSFFLYDSVSSLSVCFVFINVSLSFHLFCLNF